MRFGSWRLGWQLGRPAFLLTSILSVFAGVLSAIYAHHPVVWGYLPWLLLAACAAHWSVNVLNDYEDFQSGLDFYTPKTPFSGGSGVLVAHPEKAQSAWWFAILSLALLGAIGVYFTVVRGWVVLLFGLLGVLIILSYTRFLTKHPWLCFMAPGLGSGFLLVLGSEWVMAGALSWTGFFIAFIFWSLYNNILLLNQFPDIGADLQVGRRHYPIVLGKRKSLLLYLLNGMLASCLLLMAYVFGFFPGLSLMALPFSLGCIGVYFYFLKNLEYWPNWLNALRLNVVYVVSTALALLLAFLLSVLA